MENKRFKEYIWWKKNKRDVLRQTNQKLQTHFPKPKIFEIIKA